MQFIKDSFADKVRRGKIKSPLRQDFSIEKWCDAEKLTDFDMMLFLAGIYFHLQFETIRKNLNELKMVNVPLDNQSYLKFFLGIANRNISILMDQMTNIPSSEESVLLDISLHSKTINNNPLNIDLSISEAVIGSVDGVYYNILSHISVEKAPSNSEINSEQIFECLRAENLLSQFYNLFEQYWNGVLYEQIKFKKIEDKILFESNLELMIPYLIADTRRSQLDSHSFLIAVKFLKNNFRDKIFIEYLEHNYLFKKFSELSENKKNRILTCWLGFTEKTIGFLPKELPNSIFNIQDVIDIYIQLNAVASDLLSSLPKDTEIVPRGFDKVMEFCPIINIKSLKANLAEVSNKDESIVAEVLKFLTFNGSTHQIGPRSDLWRTPLVQVNDDQYLFILEPLLHPVGKRCFDGWMAKAGVNLDQKGTPFESYLKSNLRAILEKSNYINNFDLIELDTLSVNSISEEIDLLFKIDNLIVLGEAKCIVASDSAISYWHALSTIKKASEQAERKMEFIKENFEEICIRLQWDFNANMQYIFQPIVLTSSGVGAGYSFFNIPVVDSVILFNYFDKKECYIISTDINNHLFYLELYNSNDTLIENFSKYVANPPSIIPYKIQVECVDEIDVVSPFDNYRQVLKYKRVGIVPASLDQIIEYDYGFPKVINVEEIERIKINSLANIQLG